MTFNSRQIAMIVLLLGGSVMLSGCQNARAGVGIAGGGMLFKNTKTVFTIRRAERGGPPQPLIIPPDVKVGRSRWHGVSLNIPSFLTPVPTPPTVNPVSVGWGDGSMEKALADGGIGEVLYGDVHEFSILNGLYTRFTLIIYGTPAEEEAPKLVAEEKGG